MNAIISAVVGAIVSLSIVFLGRRSETLKQVHSLRTAAYVDFIRSVAALAALGKDSLKDKEHSVKAWESRLLLADAKARIAIYGSKAVVSSLATFLRGGYILDSEERMKAFTSVSQIMRRDSRPGPGAASDDDLRFLLFGWLLSQVGAPSFFGAVAMFKHDRVFDHGLRIGRSNRNIERPFLKSFSSSRTVS